MATAKKSRSRKPVAKKKSRRTATRPSATSVLQRKLENASTPEEMLAGLEAAQQEHSDEVKALGEQIFKLLKTVKYHPTVVLDCLQRMLVSGIGTVLGPRHEELFEMHLTEFHKESRMLSIVEALGGATGANLEELIAAAAQQGEATDEISMEDVLGGKTESQPEAVDPKDSIATEL